MYHPAAALHQPALRPALIEDFSKLPRLLGKEAAAQPKVETPVQHKEEAHEPEKKSVQREEKLSSPEQLSLFKTKGKELMVKEDLIQDIEKKRANIAVIGLGYVGLPLAVTFANAGFNVTGIDPIQEKVDMVNRGESYISDISNAQLRKHIDKGRIRATTDYATLSEIDAVSICVPTPLRKTGDPDMSFIAQASEDIAPYLHRSMIIVLESSTYPGTTASLSSQN